MKKSIILAIISLMMTSAVFAEPAPQKIGVVDLQQVVSASSEVKALKASKEAKNKELAEFVKKAQADINKQTDPAKKKTLAAQYQKQLTTKKEAISKEYTTKLKTADKNITAVISQKATALGYTMVIPKSSVIYGGDDITAQILKAIK